MSRIIAVPLLAVAFSTAAAFGQDTTKTLDYKNPRTRPLAYMLIAAEDGDVELYKFAFSKRVHDNVTGDRWEKALDKLRADVPDVYGTFKPAELQFEFTGDADSGKIIIRRGGTQKGSYFPVVREGRSWKVDSRNP